MAAQAAKAARDKELLVARDRLPDRGRSPGEMVHDQDQDRRAAGARGGMTETPAEKAAREELVSRTRITLRPIAGPLALGFFGLAAATFVMSGLQLGWVEPTEGKQVALCILAFTVPLQFTASLFGFLARDGVAATGMGLLSGIWAVVGSDHVHRQAWLYERRARPLLASRRRRDVGAGLVGSCLEARPGARARDRWSSLRRHRHLPADLKRSLGERAQA